MLAHVDLFSGIGGFALAAAENGLRTVQFVEIDPRCRDFLARAWPGVPIHDDVRTFRWGVADVQDDKSRNERARPEGRTSVRGDAPIYLLTAGVPRQPASRAGKQRGAADDRWLWPEAVRVLSEVRPTWALFENPPGIGDVGLAGVLAKVEAQGYEVRVFSIPACAVGAPHRRERYWIVGHSIAQGCEGCKHEWEPDGRREPDAEAVTSCNMGNAEVIGSRAGSGEGDSQQDGHGAASTSPWSRCVWLPCADGKVRRAPDDSQRMADGLPVELLEALAHEIAPIYQEGSKEDHYTPHRTILAALGNSIVPQVASRIIEAMREADNA